MQSITPSKNKKYFVVSIGTGKTERPLTDEFISLWGYVHWSRPMLELVTDSTSESVHEQMKYLLPISDDHQYYRLQVDLAKGIDTAIDNASSRNMRALSLAAKDFCSDDNESGQELDRLCKALLSVSKTPVLN